MASRRGQRGGALPAGRKPAGCARRPDRHSRDGCNGDGDVAGGDSHRPAGTGIGTGRAAAARSGNRAAGTHARRPAPRQRPRFGHCPQSGSSPRHRRFGCGRRRGGRSRRTGRARRPHRRGHDRRHDQPVGGGDRCCGRGARRSLSSNADWDGSTLGDHCPDRTGRCRAGDRCRRCPQRPSRRRRTRAPACHRHRRLHRCVERPRCCLRDGGDAGALRRSAYGHPAGGTATSLACDRPRRHRGRLSRDLGARQRDPDPLRRHRPGARARARRAPFRQLDRVGCDRASGTDGAQRHAAAR